MKTYPNNSYSTYVMIIFSKFYIRSIWIYISDSDLVSWIQLKLVLWGRECLVLREIGKKRFWVFMYRKRIWQKISIYDLVQAVDSIINFYLDHPVYVQSNSLEACPWAQRQRAPSSYICRQPVDRYRSWNRWRAWDTHAGQIGVEKSHPGSSGSSRWPNLSQVSQVCICSVYTWFKSNLNQN